jgi:hypothetical protein
VSETEIGSGSGSAPVSTASTRIPSGGSGGPVRIRTTPGAVTSTVSSRVATAPAGVGRSSGRFGRARSTQGVSAASQPPVNERVAGESTSSHRSTAPSSRHDRTADTSEALTP